LLHVFCTVSPTSLKQRQCVPRRMTYNTQTTRAYFVHVCACVYAVFVSSSGVFLSFRAHPVILLLIVQSKYPSINCSRPVRYLDQRNSLTPDENKNPRGNFRFKARSRLLSRGKNAVNPSTMFVLFLGFCFIIIFFFFFY
jgi:hypothetical protein